MHNYQLNAKIKKETKDYISDLPCKLRLPIYKNLVSKLIDENKFNVKDFLSYDKNKFITAKIKLANLIVKHIIETNKNLIILGKTKKFRSTCFRQIEQVLTTMELLK